MNIVKQEEQKPILLFVRASQTFCSVQAIKGLMRPTTLGRAVCSTQSANSNVSLIQKHSVNNVWPNTLALYVPAKLIHKIYHHTEHVQQLDSWSLGQKLTLHTPCPCHWLSTASFQFVSSQKPWSILDSSSHTSQTTCQKILFTYKTHSEFNHSWSLSLLIAQWELPSLLVGTYVDITCQIAATSSPALLCPILPLFFIYHIIPLFVLPVIFLSAADRTPRTVPEI